MSFETLLFLVLGGALVLVILVWSSRRTRRLYTQALEVLEGGELVTMGPFATRVRGQYKGRRVQVWKSEGSDKSPSHLHVVMEARTPFRLSLSPEGASVRLAKKLGWSSETEVGDPELDDAFLIQSEQPEEAKRLLLTTTGREVVLDLLERRFHFIQMDGENLRVRRTNYEPEDFEPENLRALLEELHVLLSVTEGTDSGRWRPDGVRPEKAPSAEAGEEAPAEAEPEALTWGDPGPGPEVMTPPESYEPIEPASGLGGPLFLMAVLLLFFAALLWFWLG